MLKFVFIVVSTFSFAQHDNATVEGQGSLVTLRMEVGAKKAKLFVVGKEAAELSAEKDTKILNITAFAKDGRKQELRFEPGQGYYTVDALPEWQDPYTLKVKTRAPKGEDEVKLQVKPMRRP